MNRNELINEAITFIRKATPDKITRMIKWMRICEDLDALGVPTNYAAYYASHLVFGWSMRKIARVNNVSHTTVSRGIRKAGDILSCAKCEATS